MIGTEKQIKWAEDIKTKIMAGAQQLRGFSAAGDKVIDAIGEIEYAEFWIDYRNFSFAQIIELLKDGISYKGMTRDGVMLIDIKTMQIVCK